jgi:hypothetical protein
MLSAIMLNAVMLSVIKLSDMMLSAMAPTHLVEKSKKKIFELTSRFSGLISRCTIILSCRYLRADVRSATIRRDTNSEYFVSAAMASKRSPPLTYSVTYLKSRKP